MLVAELWLLFLMCKTLPGMEGGWNNVLHVGYGLRLGTGAPLAVPIPSCLS